MIGTLLNIAAVMFGGSLGILLGNRLPERLKGTMTVGMGLFTAAIGVKMFLETNNPLIVLGSLILGALLGEWWRIEDGLRNLGTVLERHFLKGVETNSNFFVRGFLTASLIFCVGPMTILGSIQDGLTGDYSTLAIKSVLDGFSALAFASTFGVGVLFSVAIILAYQGGLSLLAAQLSALVTPAMMNEMTAAGGVMLLGLAISSMLEVKPIRVGNYLPALAFAPLIVWIVNLFK